MQSKSPANRKALFAFASAIAALLVVAGLSYRSRAASVASDNWVRHTHEALETLQDLAFGMSMLESGARGFVLTGNESYLESYRAGVQKVTQDQARFGAMTVDNPNQQRRLPEIAELADEKIALAERVFGVRREQGLDAAVAATRAGGGQGITAGFLAIVGDMQSEEQRLLTVRDADANRDARLTNINLILGTALALVITAAAGWSVQRDNAKRARAEEELFVEKERAQVTLNSIGDAVACTDIAGNLTFLNPVAEKMCGWPWNEAAGRPMPEVFVILDATSRKPIPDPMRTAIAQNRAMHLPPNSILIRRDGVETPIEDSVAPIHDRQGNPSGAVIAFRDVTVARTLALRMAHAAEHDFLTGLPNRMLLNDRINQAIAVAPRHKKQVAVLFLDLDGFKPINDSLGHAIGDKLLQSIADRLVACVRGSDTVSRLGGDEFVVLLSEVQHLDDAAATAARMLEGVARAHPIGERAVHVTASIGVSVYPQDGRDAATLIKNADAAMYQAKENGRQIYRFFEPAANSSVEERPAYARE